MAEEYKPLREMSDADAKEWFETTYYLFKNAKENDITRNERYEKMYQALDNPDLRIGSGDGKPENDPKMRSNNYLPIGAAVVDANVSKLYRFLFPNPEYMKISGENWEDDFYANKITAHQMKLHKEMKLQHTVFMALLESSLFDYAITGVSWKVQPGYIPTREKTVTHKQLGKLSLPYQTVEVVQKWFPDAVDRPDFFRIPYMNCYHDPGHIENGFEDSSAFFDFRFVDPDELVNGEQTDERPWGKYKNVSSVMNSFNARLEEVKKSLPTDLSTATRKELESLEQARKIKIRRCWTGDHIMEMAEDEVISRTNTSGWQLQKWTMFDLPGKFKGMGILQRMERNQYDINARMNNQRDHENLVVDPISVLTEDIVGAEGEPELYHGKAFVTSGQDASKAMWIHNPGPSPFSDSQDLITNMKIIEMVTISQTDMGAVSKGRTTAREISEVSQGADNKTSQRAELLEITCLEPAYEGMFKLSQLYMTKTQSFKHYGKNGESMMVISKGDYAFRGTPKFHALGATDTLNEPIQQRNFMQAVATASGNQEIYKNTNWQSVTTELWAMLVPKNYQAFVNDPREPSYTMNPADENKLLAIGQEVKVSPDDNDAAHIESHNAMKNNPDYSTWNQRSKNNLDNHILQHNQGEAQKAFTVSQNIGGFQDESDQLRGIREVAG